VISIVVFGGILDFLVFCLVAFDVISRMLYVDCVLLFIKFVIRVRISSLLVTLSCAKPRSLFVSARFMSVMTCFSVSGLSTYTRQRESNVEMISNDGFFVVASISRILPFFMCGRNASCCALLKR